MAKARTAKSEKTPQRRVTLFNQKTNSYEEMDAWAADLKLKHDHLKNHGGRYCKVDEVKTYVAVPPAAPKAPTAGDDNPPTA